jgi:lysophospholipase L1-like esterase
MLPIYKTILAPALLLQARQLRKTALRLPEAAGPRRGRFAGVNEPALRLLFVGDSSAAGVGVDWQHEALAYQAAEMVASALMRTVEWELVAKSGLTTSEALGLVAAHAPGPADVLVSALGVNDVTAQHSAKRFVADYRALLDWVAQRTGARAAVVSGLPPLHVLPAAPQPLRWYLGQCAQRLNDALSDLVSQTSNTKFVSLAWAQASDMAADKFHPGKLQYRAWAQLVAAQILALMPTAGRAACASSVQAR